MHIVIRAGGSGVRLWPLSRKHAPKQFQALLSEESLLRRTFERVKPAVSDIKNIYVSVNEEYMESLSTELPELDKEHIIAEPASRDTGLAMCLEVCFLSRRLPPETIVASLPSDDHISDEAAFVAMLGDCERFIGDHPDYIVTPAAKPNYPEVGYSYLQAGERLSGPESSPVYRAECLVEKPDARRARELIESGRYYWHTGMYVWRLGRIYDLFKQLQPAMFDVCERILDSGTDSDRRKENAELYASLSKMSVESAVTSRIDTLALNVAENIGWSDIGKWRSIKRILGGENEANVLDNNVIAHESAGNLVISRQDKKLIVLNHVKNLAIIETDDVLLVSDIDDSEDIKKIIEHFNEEHIHHI